MTYDWRKLYASSDFRWWTRAAISFACCFSVLLIFAYSKEVKKEGVDLVKIMIWPLFLIFLGINFGSYLRAVIVALAVRIEGGAEVSFGPLLKVGEGTKPSSTRKLADGLRPDIEIISLLHTSFYRADLTIENSDNQDWYQFEVIVVGEKEILSKITSVEYTLDIYWPERVRTITDDKTAFKLQDFSYEDTIVSAKVTLSDREDPIILNRYIDLHRRGRRLKPISW